MASQGILVMFSEAQSAVARILLQANPTGPVHLQQAAVTQPAAKLRLLHGCGPQSVPAVNAS